VRAEMDARRADRDVHCAGDHPVEVLGIALEDFFRLADEGPGQAGDGGESQDQADFAAPAPG